jgi:ABC-type hemin transport system ATPase subunit
MQIAYLWIEEFRGIKQQGINLNGQFNFIYDSKSHSLSVSENLDFIDEFYGKSISSITAIVGENGAGKTSILDFIKDRIGHERPIRNKMVLVYSENNTTSFKVVINTSEDKFKIIHTIPKSRFKLTIIHLKDILLKYKNNELEEPKSFSSPLIANSTRLTRGFYRSKQPSLLELIPDFKKSIIVFYSNIFDYRTEASSSFVYNLSTNFIEAKESTKTRFVEIKSQVDLLIRKNILPEDLGITPPEFISARIRIPRSYPVRNDRLYFDDPIRSNINQFINLLAFHLTEAIKRSRIDSNVTLLVCVDLLANFCYEVCLGHKAIYVKEFIRQFTDTLTASKTIIDDVAILNHVINEINRSINQEIRIFSPDTAKANNKLASNLKKVFDFIIDFRYRATIHLGYYTFTLRVSAEDANETKSFIEAYIGSINQRGLIEMNWQDMSSGEKARLAFLARLNSMKSDTLFKDFGQGKSIILLIDEGEQYFHPQWQKNYVQFLVTYLPKLFPDVNMQIILTSHSPFVLSDLFRENIIYLAKNPKTRRIAVIDNATKEKTLAANIHTLFTDAYFMQGGLIGTHVQIKMQEILEPLAKGVATKEQAKTILRFINSIGEPILRTRLLNMYNQATFK